MGTLFVVNHARSVADCLAVAGAPDAVLLIEDAVYAATQPLASPAPLYALANDVLARGLTRQTRPQVEVIDDAGFVELVVAYAPIVTWR
jgi:sulfur relay protein TusB/DsrH